MAVEQRVGVTVVAGLHAGGRRLGPQTEVGVVGAQATKHGPLVCQVHRVHGREGEALDLPVAALGIAAVRAASQGVDVGDGCAIGRGDAIRVVGASTSGRAAVGGAGRGAGVVARHHLVVGVLEAEDHLVLLASELCIPAQIGLVREIFHVLPAGVAAVDGGAVRGRVERCTRGGVRVLRLAVARQAVDGLVARQAVFDPRRQGVHVGAQEVIGLCVNGYAGCGVAGRRRAHQVRAQIGCLVFGAQAVVVQRDRQVLAQLPQARQGEAFALALGRVAVWHTFVAVEGVHAQRELVAEGLVGVSGQAQVAVGAGTGRDAGEVVIQRGLFGDGVDGAACGAAASKAGVGALGDFQLLDGEAFAGGHARVAQAVHKDIALGFLATDDVAVAERVAVFSGAQRDAGLGREHLFEVGQAGVVDGRLGHHGEGLWRFRQRACVARVARGLGLVGRTDFGIGVGVDRLFLHRHGGQGGGGCGGLRQGAQGQQHGRGNAGCNGVGQTQTAWFFNQMDV